MCVCLFFLSNIAATVSQQCEMLWEKIVECANVYVLNTVGPFIQLRSQNDGELVTCVSYFPERTNQDTIYSSSSCINSL